MSLTSAAAVGSRSPLHVLLVVALALLTTVWTHAQQSPASAEDAAQPDPSAEDDDTNAVAEKTGPSFIPIPMFITEPAIGYGLGVAVAYFHPRDEEPESPAGTLPPGLTEHSAASAELQHRRPPDITFLGGGYTDKGTWLLAGGHSASWKEDRIRYTGVLAYANIESTFYFVDLPFQFNLRGGTLYQSLRVRLGSSNVFLGGKLSYLNTDARLAVGEQAPVAFPSQQVSDLGVAIQAVYEGRDNTMTPNSGQLVELTAWRHIEALGSDFDYWKGTLKLVSFHPVADRFVLGLRLDANAVTGGPPLWSYPWISLRGIPALRYQNERTAVAESELRWDVLPRWSLLGFVGVGATRGDVPQYVDENGVWSGGIGARYLYRPQDQLRVGIDIARGPEDWAVYVQVGQAW